MNARIDWLKLAEECRQPTRTLTGIAMMLEQTFADYLKFRADGVPEHPTIKYVDCSCDPEYAHHCPECGGTGRKSILEIPEHAPEPDAKTHSHNWSTDFSLPVRDMNPPIYAVTCECGMMADRSDNRGVYNIRPDWRIAGSEHAGRGA